MKHHESIGDEVARKLEALAERTEQREPQFFEMFAWAEAKDCGTVCCLAGDVAQNAGWAFDFDDTGEAFWCIRGDERRPIATVAAEELGLSNGQSQRLFRMSGWPHRFVRHTATYMKNPTPQQAADRIRHFIQTGE